MKLMVIDGNSIINRAFYGVRPLTTREGLHTNAVYGFVTTLQKLLDEEAPEALCVTFDRREPTFRHLSYEGYKAQRKGMPEELAQQLPVLKEVLDAMDIPRYELAGYEADDLIGTISRKCEAAGWACVVVTGDKDSLQLITDKTKVKLVSTRIGQTTTKDMTEEAFREAYGFDPIHIIDLKALMGDASDNIPGVPGVGEKTALDLVRRYQSVEALYAALPGIDAKPGVIKKLQAGEESARMSYRLATIVTDAPLAFDPEANLRREPKGALRDVLLKLEFTKLMDKLLPAAPAPAETEVFEGTCESEIVADWDRVQALLAIFRRRDHVACLVLPDLRGVCVEWGDGNEGRAAVFLPTRLENYNGFLRAFFAPGIKKVSYEVKDLTRSLLAEGLPAEDIVFDVALAGYLLDATAGRYDLERLAMSWFHAAVPKAGAYLAPEAFTALGESAEALGALMSHTALIDALYGEMGPKLEERQVEALYFDVEHPLCRVLAEMELAGFLVDAGALQAFGQALDKAIAQLEERICSYAGPFNINSPKQLGEVLFERLGLPSYKKTKTGYSTSAEVLEKLRGAHPIVGEVLEYRQYAKLKSTYVDGLLKVIGPDGRVHSTFNQTEARTGRISSTEPNLQNISVRDEEGREIRKAFVAEEGHVFLSADYSQIELRMLAHMADETQMIDAFSHGSDIHTRTAAQIFDVSEDEVDASMRRSAKTVNFGIVYGQSDYGLSEQLGITRKEAHSFIEKYFASYPKIHAFMNDTIAFCEEHGYVTTMFQRRRYIPEISDKNYMMREFGKRAAMNAPIQGSAADLIKMAMIAIDKKMQEEQVRSRMILQIHDELIFDVPEDEVEQMMRIVKEGMQNVVKLKVPLVANASIGRTWYEAK